MQTPSLFAITFTLLFACGASSSPDYVRADAFADSTLSPCLGPATPDYNIQADREPNLPSPDSLPNCKNGWCRISPGSFVFGSPETEFGHPASAENQVTVTLTYPFEIQQFETQRKEWFAQGFSYTDRPDAPMGVPDSPEIACKLPECPITNVPWYEALNFANAVSKAHSLPECYTLTGCAGTPGIDFTCTGAQLTTAKTYDCKGYRLPTTFEYEYAGRAGATGATYAGEIVGDSRPGYELHEAALDHIAWYIFNSHYTTHPVGYKIPNAWGLFGVIGNVAEWSSTEYNPEGYVGPVTDPGTELAVRRPVLRSSPIYSNRDGQRLAAMLGWGLGLRDLAQGIRLVRTLPK